MCNTSLPKCPHLCCVKILSLQKSRALKKNKLLATLIILSVVLIVGCQKDDYKEILGVCPVVVSTNPDNLRTGVPLNQVITVTFNGAMNPATITTSAITLQGPGATPGTISYSGLTASFTPSSPLKPNTTYTGRVNTTVKDVTGNALQTDYVWTFTTGAEGVELNSIARFGILAGSGISSAGFSVINNMDIGVSPGLRASITGFPPATLVNGAIYASNDLVPSGVFAMLSLAKQNLTTAYQFAENAASPVSTPISGDQGGKTLTPGIYKSTATLLIQSGDLTLDARGDTSAVWIFQVGSDLTTIGGAGGDVNLTGGAQAKNVFWQVGSSATIGNNTAFKGILMALTSITLNPGATIDGRLFAINGAVVLTSTNIINKP